jgi:hypothetical protein
MRANKKRNKKIPKAQTGMIIGTALSTVPQAIAAYQGYKATQDAKQRQADLEAMMPSLTSQEDYYNYYQKQAQLLNQSKLQEQLDRTVSEGAKTLSGAGTRAVLGGVQGMVTGAQEQKANLTQQQGQQLLGAYEKMIQAKDADRTRLLGLQSEAQAAQTAGMATYLQGLQGLGDTALQGGLEYQKFKEGYYKEKGGTIEKTPGEFSHKTNPIDVVQDGTKIAEMTGGEYIFNPKQMAAIKKLVSQKDSNKLHSYMKSIIKKFEKKAKS